MRFQPIHRRHLVSGFVLAGLLIWTTVQADHDDHEPADDEEYDHERARDALDRGEVRPIAEILARVAAHVQGEVIKVEFEHEGHHETSTWIYELKVIDRRGRLLEVTVDAATGRILELEED